MKREYKYEIVNTYTDTLGDMVGVITRIDYIFKIFSEGELIKSEQASVKLAPPSDEFIELDNISHGDLIRFIEKASPFE